MQGLRCALLVFAVLVSPAAFGQAYPAKPVKFVVPYPPGASTDTVARAVAQKLSDSLGQQVFVENRPGASGNIGSDYVAKSAPDGYTILLGTDATHTTNVHFGKNFPYDPVRDFTPITAAVGNIIVLAAHPSVPITSVKELIEYAKKNPGRLAYASSGTGSPHHLSGELLRQLAGIDIVHVPYKGGGQAIIDFVGGQVPLMFSSLVAVAPHIKSGKVRALGVVEAQRYAAMPDVPTIAETLPGFEINSWLGFLGPAGLPPPIQARLQAEIVKALNAPDVRARLEPAGLIVIGNTPAEFSAMIRTDLDKRGRLIKAAGIPTD
ncbi:MAG: Bug family tripartite tricarboxylate transporter substrate binding protein [Burkholderiales bacterium]